MTADRTPARVRPDHERTPGLWLVVVWIAAWSYAAHGWRNVRDGVRSLYPGGACLRRSALISQRNIQPRK